MTLPTTIGPPRDWRVGPQHVSSTRQFHRKASVNELGSCSVPGCSTRRSGISRYCGKHTDSASSRGDPIARLPTANELKLFKHAVKLYLEVNPRLAQEVTASLSQLDRSEYLPPSFQLRYGDIHNKLPQVAKAKGLLANWYHGKGRGGGAYSDCVLHALALLGWSEVYYDGLPENRHRFTSTCAGARLGVIYMRPSGGSPARHYLPSGATRRLLGDRFIRHAKATYGSNFWSSAVRTSPDVSTSDGHTGGNATTDMTILAYTRQALRIAGLLPHPNR